MSYFMRKGARSEKGRPICSSLVLEQLERRNLFAGLPTVPGLGLDLGIDQGVLSDTLTTAQPAAGGSAASANTNGAAGEIPALFNDQSFTINVKELSDTASASIIAHNKSLQIIYVTNDLDEKQDFTPVINAVPGQGFNALWLQVKISFNPGVTPQQFTSEADILAAAKAGKITLTSTGEVYRDSVVGGH